MLKWHADAIAAIALTVALIAVVVTGNRMQVAVTQTARADRAAFAESTITRVASQTMHLARLSGEPSPSVISNVLKDLPRNNLRRGYIVFVYTPSACERSIKDGLESIHALERPLADAGYETVVISGVSSAMSKELALLTRDDIAYASPLRFAPRRAIEVALFDPADAMFGEEPIVLFADSERRVLSAIHTDQFRPNMLRTWLQHRVEVPRGH